MAIDTRDKRSSSISVSLPWRGLLPVPDGALNQADRQHVGLHYSGVLADPPGGAVTGGPLVGGFLVNRSKLIGGRLVG